MNGRIIGAVILILLGTIFLVNNLGLADIRIYEVIRTWWPLILIAIGVSMLIKQKPDK